MRIAPVIYVLSAMAALSLPVLADQANPPVSFHLSSAVTAGNQQLAPGDYTIQQLPNNANVFAIYNQTENTFETLLMARPVQNMEPVNKTDVVIRNEGGTFVIDSVQIEGRDLAYEFGSPEPVVSRNRASAGRNGD
jgi:hypothetical protein